MSLHDVLPLSEEKRAQGFGTFPYVILRVTAGVFMQFPIHFYENKNPEKPGLRVRVDSISNEKQNYSSLFNVVRQFHMQINPTEAKAMKMCLVLAPFVAYFFEHGAFTFSDEIPHGGSLIDSNFKVLALNSAHFVTD
jgi:hypothetical protein